MSEGFVGVFSLESGLYVLVFGFQVCPFKRLAGEAGVVGVEGAEDEGVEDEGVEGAEWLGVV
jgi:uncharacterized protein GlcG (DUF336 family)